MSNNSEETYKDFLFDYPFEGHRYVFEITAKNADEAKRRVSDLAWAQYQGEIKAKIQIAPNFFTHIFNWFRVNWFRR